MNARVIVGTGLLFAAFLVLPLGLAGQGAGDTPPPQQGDTLQLVFEREVFAYPSHPRRNPFRPLGRDDVGPTFEDLVLLGTIVTDVSADGVALLGVRDGARSGGSVGSVTHRLRVGQRIGNTRILEIQYRRILVEVEEFGLTERRVMDVVRTEPEAAGDDAADSPPVQGDTINPPPDSVPPPGGQGGGLAGAGGSGTGADGDVETNGTGGT